jgi:tRNA A37 threonylcarbamoyladenosine dehydratase
MLSFKLILLNWCVSRLYTDPTTSVNDDKVDDEIDDGLEPHLQVVERLSKATVIVVGLGGVGSWAAEALCRSGIGNLVMIDLDDICISNTNRQLHATSTTVGKMKIDQMQQRLLDINPECNITLIHDFVSHNNIDSILESIPGATACLDAIDGAVSKSALIAGSARFGIPLVTVGGSAGRTDPTKIVCEDLVRVSGDPLLKACKKNLRRNYGFEQGKKCHQEKAKPSRKFQIHAVVSEELQKRVPQGDTSSLRRCDGALGTACFVTGSFGFVAAGKIIEMIASDNLVAPRGFKIPVPLEESM